MVLRRRGEGQGNLALVNVAGDGWVVLQGSEGGLGGRWEGGILFGWGGCFFLMVLKWFGEVKGVLRLKFHLKAKGGYF